MKIFYIKKTIYLVFIILLIGGSLSFLSSCRKTQVKKEIEYFDDTSVITNTDETSNDINDSSKYKVALFTPRASDFWNRTAAFMKTAAKSLNIELYVFDAESDHYLLLEQVKEVVSGNQKVDVVVFNNFKDTAAEIIQLAEENHVYAFQFNSIMSPEKREEMGAPREKYKYWIGELYPDELSIGKIMNTKITEEAIRRNLIHNDQMVHLFGFNGPKLTGGAISRRSALDQAIDDRDDIIIDQIINIPNWSRDEVIKRFPTVYNRHPYVNIIWTANANMASGVIDSLKQMGIKPGVDLLVSGYDMSAEVLQSIEDGEILWTLGGHSIDGAWVMVLLYDYLHDVDFATEFISRNQPMSAITAQNIHLFKKINNLVLPDGSLKEIDFRKFTKYHNENLTKYEFYLEEVLKEL